MKTKTLLRILLLIVVQFIVDKIFVFVYPTVNPVRASLIGITSFIFLVGIYLIKKGLVNPIRGGVSIFSSALFGALLVQGGYLVSKSVLSAIVHIVILIITYFVFGFIVKHKSTAENRFHKKKKPYTYILLVGVIFLIIASIFLIQKFKAKIKNTVEGEQLGSSENVLSVQEKAKKYPQAIELVEPDGYLNIDNITIKELIGKKVILIDFWTYSCINCQRTIPYLNAWYEKYKEKGFIIIGVHTPEFDFEKDYENVKRAIEKFGIKYPVVQDNEYKTWRAYKNRYWPHKYLIDIDGYIVYDHIGEGAYEETEEKIQELLEERNKKLRLHEFIQKTISQPDKDDTEFQNIGTPELYFGYGFSRNQLGNSEGWNPDEVVQYKYPNEREENKFYLSGEWKNNYDNMELISLDGSIFLQYYARNVYLVAGAEKPVEVTISLDGKEYKKITISDFDLYTLISEKEYSAHTVEIQAKTGLRVYTFTFG